jgi:hypothetical protein
MNLTNLLASIEQEGIPEEEGSKGKYITKVGTQFCIRSDGIDSNFGCWPNRAKAEAVMSGKSFIEPDLHKNLLANKVIRLSPSEFRREERRAGIKPYVKGGGPGSGRRPSINKPLKPVKPFSDESPKTKARIRSNPNQTSLFGPGHTKELQEHYKGKTPSSKPAKTHLDPDYQPWGGKFERKDLEAVIGPPMPKFNIGSPFKKSEMGMPKAGPNERGAKLRKGVGHKMPNMPMPGGNGSNHRFPNPQFEAGGVGSGRHPGSHKLTWECKDCGHGIYKNDIKKNPIQEKQCPECGSMRQDQDLKAGGPGSGRHKTIEVIEKHGGKYDQPKKFGGRYGTRRAVKSPSLSPGKWRDRYGNEIAVNDNGSWTHYNSNGFMTTKIAEGKDHKSLDKHLAKNMQADGNYGEPMAGAMQHAHLDSRMFFHPPSLKNPDHVPTDDPGEKDDRFLDVTRRKSKDTQEQRMKLLKRSTPGGNPPMVPVHTTAVSPFPNSYSPMYAGRMRRRHGGGMFRKYGAAKI